MPFELVGETLLKGGIAPRRVRRYLRELNEHLDDLTAAQRAAGHDGDEARARARALLGSDGELAAAMLNQPGLRSWPARLPWLVFVALPPVATVLAFAPVFIAFYFLGDGAAKISAAIPALSPEALRAISKAMLAAVNIASVPAVAAALAVMAARQRLRLLWPLLGITLLLFLMPQFGYRFGILLHPHTGSLSLEMAPLFSQSGERHWPELAVKYALCLLPLAWLLRRRAASRITPETDCAR